ncbi:hypothetical protein Acr_26g0001480 [Actinidia rufa]|uniref:Uncharacterized protein n=1 Tax=Actinidia rufa TaxID=165716 RepID=A0A7J0H1I8_9ERIC|nr:hypothetical protein Acr_26g0001480 [Actinidia rufa]
MANQLGNLVESIKSKVRSLKKSKKPYVKMDKSASVKVEIRSRQARKLIDKTLKVADRPGKRSRQHNVVCPAPPVPRNPSVGSANEVVNGEDVRELVRVGSKRDAGTKVEMVKVDGLKEEGKLGASGMRRSYTVGFERIRRIDEDKPCEFEEEEDHHVQARGNIRDQLLYPRSKT